MTLIEDFKKNDISRLLCALKREAFLAYIFRDYLVEMDEIGIK